MEKPIGLFDFLAGMMQDKREFDFSNPEINSAYEQQKINRWLSMCDVFLPFVAELNRRKLPNDVHYEFLKNILPKKKVWLDYIKRPREISYDQMVMLAKHFKTNLKNAETMLHLISEEELIKIINIEEVNYESKKS